MLIMCRLQQQQTNNVRTYTVILIQDGWCSVLALDIWGYMGYYCTSLTCNRRTTATFNQLVQYITVDISEQVNTLHKKL